MFSSVPIAGVSAVLDGELSARQLSGDGWALGVNRDRDMLPGVVPHNGGDFGSPCHATLRPANFRGLACEER